MIQLTTKYLVLPVSLMRCGEGKNNLYYSYHVLHNSVDRWNGIPIILNDHSLNDAANMQNRVGYVMNARMDHTLGFLKAEAWFDEDRLEQRKDILARIALRFIRRGIPMESSVGFMPNTALVRNNFPGEPVTLPVTMITPNHLTVLLDQKGYFSLKDGGGVNNGLTNNSGERSKPLIVTSYQCCKCGRPSDGKGQVYGNDPDRSCRCKTCVLKLVENESKAASEIKSRLVSEKGKRRARRKSVLGGYL